MMMKMLMMLRLERTRVSMMIKGTENMTAMAATFTMITMVRKIIFGIR